MTLGHEDDAAARPEQGAPPRPPLAWGRLTPDQKREFVRRRQSRAVATAIVLGALAVLIFALAIAKIHAGWKL